MQALFQSAQHIYEKREGSGSVPLTIEFGFGRSILCLPSSKILTPHPLTAQRLCTPPPLVRGEDTLARRRWRWGVKILEDVRHSSVLYVCKYFVVSMHFQPCRVAVTALRSQALWLPLPRVQPDLRFFLASEKPINMRP